MVPTSFQSTDAIPEESDAEYTCTFHDAGPDAEQLDSAAILSLTATLVDVSTNEIINGRNEQDVLNTNGGTLTSEGVFTLRLSGPDDNLVITERRSVRLEQHRLTLMATYNRVGGTGYLNHEVTFFVRRLYDVPAYVTG